MKTNKVTRIIVALMAVVLFCSMAAGAFAQTESAPAAEEKSGKSGRRMKDDIEDWFEDWFEDRIEALEDKVDFSELPEEPTEEELMDFFVKYFMDDAKAEDKDGKADAPKHGGKHSDKGKPGKDSTEGSSFGKDHKPGKDRPEGRGFGKDHKPEDPRADRFDDWFEDRIEGRGRHVDFSELPENPTDEEIVEFFRKYFMDGDSVVNFGKPKGPRHPGKPEAAPEAAPETEPAPETEAAPEAEIPQENSDAAPAEEQPAAETDNAA